MRGFLATYFGWQASLAQVIWVIVMSVVGRLALWLFGVVPQQGEVWYWVVAFLAFLSVMAAYQYVSWSFAPKPDLRVTIERTTIAPMPGEPSNTSLVLEVVVRNAGTPSVAEEWTVSVELPGQKSVPATVMGVPEVLTLRGNKGTLTYSGKDALYQKTVEKPIPSGGRVAGILWCKVLNVRSDILIRPGTCVALGYRDVTGLRHTASVELSGIEGSLSYLPGLQLPEK